MLLLSLVRTPQGHWAARRRGSDLPSVRSKRALLSIEIPYCDGRSRPPFGGQLPPAAVSRAWVSLGLRRLIRGRADLGL
jgi:hypothetical protein